MTTLGTASYAISSTDSSTFTFRDASQASTVQNYNHAAYVARNSTLTIDDSSVSTQGTGAYGVFARNTSTANVLDHSTVSTLGQTAYGVVSQQSSLVNVVDSTINTAGASAVGAYTFYGSQIDLTNTTLSTTGAGAYAFYANAPAGVIDTFNATNSVLNSQNAATLVTNGGITNIILTGTRNDSGTNQLLVVNTAASVDSPFDIANTGVEVAGPLGVSAPEPLLVAANPSFVSLVADSSELSGNTTVSGGSTADILLRNGTALTGDASADSASTLNMSLASASHWTGAALNITNALVDPTSTWTVTANSNLTQQLTNAGLVEFTAPAGGVFKTLTTMNYVGAGGTLGINTFLGTDGSPSDRLVINAGAATGNSDIRVANAGGPGALTTGNGILVVDTINAGTTAPDAFALANPGGYVAEGPYAYRLFRGSVDASNDQAWYLRSTIDCSVTPSDPICDQPQPPPGPIPDYRPETSLYAAIPSMALLYGRVLLDTLHERVGEEEDLRDSDRLNKPASGAWARVIAQHGSEAGSPIGIYGDGPKFNYTLGGFQFGQDLYRRDGSDGSRDHAGLYGALGRFSGDVTHFDNTAAGSNYLDAYTLGGYWTHFGPSGWYTDALAQGTRFDVSGISGRLPNLSTSGWSFAGSLEAGYPLHFDNGFVVEPQAQIVYQTICLDDATDTAANVQFRDVNSLEGRLGVRLAKSWAMGGGADPRQITTWIRPNLWYEFRGAPQTLFSSADGPLPFQSNIGGARLELNAGLSADMTKEASLFANASYQTSISGNASHEYDGKIGLRMKW